MRLVKRGSDPKTRIYAGSCHNCKSEFEALASELHIEDSREGTLARESCTVCKASQVILYPTSRYKD